ncbi:MAG: peptidase M16 family protein, partial [Planctomycetota bacterium]
MLRSFGCGVLLLCTEALTQGATGAADIAGLTWHHVHAAGAGRVGVVLAWPVGAVHDPAGRTGFAQAMRALLELCQRDRPSGKRFVVEARGRFTLMWAAVPVQELSEHLGFLARLLAGKIEITADLHVLALARARLLADDNTRLYPGPALYNKARCSLYPGRATGRSLDGVPAEIAAISRAELTARYADHYGTRGAVLATVGGLTREHLESRLRQHLAAPSGADRLPGPVAPAAAEPVVSEEIHRLVDGPYVTMAFPAPAPDKPSAAFLVAVLALRYQAQPHFGAYRGAEWRARFTPFVRYDYLAGDPLVMINRRGRDGAAATGARQEIERFLVAVKRHGLRQRLLQLAKLEIDNTLRRPWQGGQREVALRARILCVRGLLGFDDGFVAQVQDVTDEDARAALLQHLRDDMVCWLAFLPEPSVKLPG